MSPAQAPKRKYLLATWLSAGSLLIVFAALAVMAVASSIAVGRFARAQALARTELAVSSAREYFHRLGESNLVAAQYLLECRIIHAPTRRVECEVFPAGFITVEDDRVFSGIAHLHAVVRLVSASQAAPARPIAIGR